MNYLSLARGLGSRFLFVGLMPVLTVAVVVAATILAGAPADPPEWDSLLRELGRLSAGEAIALGFATVVAALALQPLQLRVVRMLEGYWGQGRLPRAAMSVGIGLQRRRKRRLNRRQQHRGSSEPTPSKLAQMAAAADRLRDLPDSDRLLPTTLGNVLRAAEDRGGRRYGLDTVALWPHLHAVLPAAYAQTLAGERDALDAAANMCAAWMLGSVALAALLFEHGWWLLLSLAAVGLAGLSYAGAVAVASAYSRSIEAAFDLYRFDLLTALHLPLPAESEEERAANEALTHFVVAGERDAPVRYEHPVANPLAVSVDALPPLRHAFRSRDERP